MKCICNKQYRFLYKSVKLKRNVIHPELENFRCDLYKRFEKEFIDFFVKRGLASTDKTIIKIQKAFGRWIMLQISLGYTTRDPVIPYKLDEKSFVQLKEDIENFSEKKTVQSKALTINADDLVADIKLEKLCKKYDAEIGSYIKDHNIKTLDNLDIVSVSHGGGNKYTLKVNKCRTISVSKAVHDRIKILFITNQTFNQNLKNDNLFYYLLYCLMLRYIAISDQGVRQGAKPQAFFDALEEFNINFETFAASFAASSNHICSLFYDIEKYFGSYGNFFDLVPQRGFYQVNPPLDSLITVMAVERVLHILQNTKETKKLGFILFIPAWDFETIKAKGYTGKLEKFNDFPIYYKAKDSKYLVYNYNILGKKIKYVQYQSVLQDSGIYETEEQSDATYDYPHVMILGTTKFRQTFDAKKMERILNSFSD